MGGLLLRLKQTPSGGWSKAVPPRLSLYFSRHLHQRRPLKYPLEGGVGDFLSPAALKTIAVDYQEGLLARLNDEVRGTELANKSVVHTVVLTALDSARTLAFNYASQALNNSFFLDSIKPPPAKQPEPSERFPDLFGRIRDQFGGPEQLKSTFCASALGFSGSGWLWLLTDENGYLAVFPTFGSGTLLVRARRQQTFADEAAVGEDLERSQYSRLPGDALPPMRSAPTPSLSSEDYVGAALPASTNIGGGGGSDPYAFGTQKASVYGPEGPAPDDDTSPSPMGDKIYNKGNVLFPLFCVSVHEHAWMCAGYGVWGKEEYMKRFWNVVDWDHANANYRGALRQGQRPSS